MKYLNINTPSVIISKDGVILMSNERFDYLVSEKLGLKSMPNNLIKMMQSDTEAKKKLTRAL